MIDQRHVAGNSEVSHGQVVLESTSAVIAHCAGVGVVWGLANLLPRLPLNSHLLLLLGAVVLPNGLGRFLEELNHEALREWTLRGAEGAARCRRLGSANR